MDRREALSQLEGVHDSSEANEPELAAARAWLENDPEARDEFERRLQSDARIGAAMRNVTPPAGLREKLLEAVQPSTAAAPAPQASPRRRGVNRRVTIATVVCLAALGIGGYLMTRQPTALTWETIVTEAPRSSDAIEALEHDAPAATRSASAAWSRRQATVSRGWSPDDGAPTSELLAAAQGRWILVITPVSRMDTESLPPFGAGGTIPETRGGYTIGGWKDDNFVYVLMVRGNRQNYETVRHEMIRTA